MREMFTTGEAAQRCNVSVRTIQYYDKEGLLKPSELSEGGRRLYTEEDLAVLKCICLYKTLGFSLAEIKSMVHGNSNNEYLVQLLEEQQKKLSEQIEELAESKVRLQVIREELKDSGVITVKTIDEVNDLLKKKERHRKTDIMTYILLGCYLLITVAGFPVAISLGGISPVMFIVIVFLLLLGLVYYHKENSAYICSKCRYKFTISFIKDLFSLNGGAKGKYLKCPNCGKRSWMKETFKD